MAKKRKNSRNKMRQKLYRAMKDFAAFLYWLLSFSLIAWELWDKITG